MEKIMLEKQIEQFVMENRLNYVSEEEAIAPEYAGLRMYDPPIWGYGDANDPMFEELKRKRRWENSFSCRMHGSRTPKVSSVSLFRLRMRSKKVTGLMRRSRLPSGCTPGLKDSGLSLQSVMRSREFSRKRGS